MRADTARRIERIIGLTSVMDVSVQSTSIDDLLERLEVTVACRSPTLFVGIYPSLARILRQNPEYADTLRSACVYPDGVGVVWALRLMKVEVPARMATTDIIWDVLALAEKRRWRVMLYGGRPGVAERVAINVQKTHPSLQVVSVRDGFENLDVDSLRTIGPDVLLVARGAPMQEIWSRKTAIPAGVPATFTCGGLFDFIAGEVRRAPTWVTRFGLEWVFRVVQEPRRLFWRYAIGNALFVGWFLRDTLLRRRARDS